MHGRTFETGFIRSTLLKSRPKKQMTNTVIYKIAQNSQYAISRCKWTMMQMEMIKKQKST